MEEILDKQSLEGQDLVTKIQQVTEELSKTKYELEQKKEDT